MHVAALAEEEAVWAAGAAVAGVAAPAGELMWAEAQHCAARNAVVAGEPPAGLGFQRQ